MKKIAVVYWSGTGNTEAMANAIAQGAKEAGAQAELFTPATFRASMISDFAALAFGCSAQGAETLEEYEFEPMWAACEGALGNRPVALFGSYDWGDGEWMRTWESRCRDAGVNLASEGLKLHNTPDEAGVAQCKALGAQLAQ